MQKCLKLDIEGYDECKECNSEFRIEVCGTLHLLSPHYKVNSEGNQSEYN